MWNNFVLGRHTEELFLETSWNKQDSYKWKQRLKLFKKKTKVYWSLFQRNSFKVLSIGKLSRSSLLEITLKETSAPILVHALRPRRRWTGSLFLSQGLYLQISTTGKRDPLPTARCLCWNVAQIKSSIWNLSSLSFRANDCATEDSVPLFDCHFSLFLNSFTKLGLLCVSPDSDTNDTTLSDSLVTLRRQENTKRRAVHRMCKCARKSQKRGVKKKIVLEQAYT